MTIRDMDNNENVYLVGDVRYTEAASFIHENTKAPIEFLTSLQKLMEEFGVVKIDVSIDAFKFTGRNL